MNNKNGSKNLIDFLILLEEKLRKSEEVRVIAEEARKKAEEARIIAEEARCKAEAIREEIYQKLKKIFSEL